MGKQADLLYEELNIVDTDLGFLFLIVTAVLLSYRATVRQRDALYFTLHGDAEGAKRAGEVTGLRLGAGALVVGSLGFFFMQALKTCGSANPDDPTARRSAWSNLIASFLVLLAALIRLLDLNFVRRVQPVLAEELPPD